jgi:6-phosphogluconolactonase
METRVERDEGSSDSTFVYVGGYGGSISTFLVDPASGALTPKGAMIRASSPSFLSWSSPTRNVYAVSEVTAGRVAAYSVDVSTGALTLVNDASSAGATPAHLLAERSGRWVLVANYDGGSAAVLPVLPNGGVGTAVDIQSFGPGSLPHQIAVEPGNQFAFVVLKGADAIAQFRLDATSGKLVASTPARLKVAKASGPRHLAFHPGGKFAYLISEQASTMTAYSFDAASGTLTEMQTLSTRAADASVVNTTAEVAVHPSGRWLYGSNRGDDDIVQYSLGDSDGRMTLVGHVGSGGKTPRHFSIDPTGHFLWVANQDSDSLVVFSIGADGRIARAGNPIGVSGAMPSFIGAAVLS